MRFQAWEHRAPQHPALAKCRSWRVMFQVCRVWRCACRRRSGTCRFRHQGVTGPRGLPPPRTPACAAPSFLHSRWWHRRKKGTGGPNVAWRGPIISAAPKIAAVIMDGRSSVRGTGPLFRGPNLRGHDRIPELAVVYLAITANLLLARQINSLDVVLVGRIAWPVGQRILAGGIRRTGSGERGPVID